MLKASLLVSILVANVALASACFNVQGQPPSDARGYWDWIVANGTPEAKVTPPCCVTAPSQQPSPDQPCPGVKQSRLQRPLVPAAPSPQICAPSDAPGH